MTNQPFVSLILVVRNGMPLLPEALASVQAQTYRNFELVVQDGASTDGTLESLERVTDVPSISIVSEPDSGIGQAYNRALGRCRGQMIGSIDSDNLLYPHALETIVTRFAEHPDAAVIYTACDMIHADGSLSHYWAPPAFDLLGLLDGSVVPPFGTSFFAPRICGDALEFDERMQTVADFDLWLRLSHLNIVRAFDALGAVRMSEKSSTWNADNYTRMVALKIASLRRFIDRAPRGRVLDQLRERCEAGIHLWALDSMASIDGDQEHRDELFKGTRHADLRSSRFRDTIGRVLPRVDPGDSDFVEALNACAEEYIRNQNADSAAPFVKVLEASGCLRPELAALLEPPRGASIGRR
jgi:hypothetical protein